MELIYHENVPSTVFDLDIGVFQVDDIYEVHVNESSNEFIGDVDDKGIYNSDTITEALDFALYTKRQYQIFVDRFNNHEQVRPPQFIDLVNGFLTRKKMVANLKHKFANDSSYL